MSRGGSSEGVIDIFDGVRIKQIISKSNDSRKKITETAEKVINIIRDEDLDRKVPIAIDDTGVGGGVTDILDGQGYNVIPVILKSRADEEEKYFDLRSEIFWDVRNYFKSNSINIPNDDKLKGQLASLKYGTDRKGRIQLVSKEKMEKEGFESPDRADALSLAVYSIKGSRRARRGQIPNSVGAFGGGAGGY